MKFRNRTTGEIIEVTLVNDKGDFAEIQKADGSLIHITTGNLYNTFERLNEDVINWEQRRYEIAKVMLPTCVEEYSSMDDFRIEKGAEYAVMCADALINELKKKGTNNEKH